MSHTDIRADDLIGQRQRRIQSLQELRKLGIDPFPSRSNRTHTAGEIHTRFEDLQNQTVTVSGRLMSWRDHGKLRFGDLQEQSGTIQLFFKKDTLNQNLSGGMVGWDHLKLFDGGDMVEATGIVTKTTAGQISVLVTGLKMLAKSIRPLPNELADKEQQFRKRYLDLILHPEKKERFAKTAEITFAIREFLYGKGFLEIKTPILQPIYGGGMAKPFKTHVNSLDVDVYLAISHELYLKRLITAGFENVFNITGYFRNEGIDRTHNPEFSMLETMTAFKNYEYNMDLTEEMYRYITKKVFGTHLFTIRGQEVDFSKPWRRISMVDAVKEYAEHDFFTLKTLEEAHAILKQEGIEERPSSIGESMVRVFEERVEEHLIEPTFVMNHPVEISPLAKRCADDPRFVERFEIFIGGIEGGDNWTELNDPLDLFERFKGQLESRKGGNDEAHPMDVEFLEMMEYAMPPTTGLGPGIERLAMMLTGTEYIDDVIFFPMMKPAPPGKQHREIYGNDIFAVELEQLSATKQGAAQKAVLKLTREAAFQIVDTHIHNKNLVKHCLAVEAAMRGIARRFHEDEDLWGLAGLLHDADWEETTNSPDQHTRKTIAWVEATGENNADLFRTILAHNHTHNGEPAPQTPMEWALYTCDELTGIITATTLIQPDKKLAGVTVEKVLKKFANKNFAAAIDREQIKLCEHKLGIALEEYIAIVLQAMQDNADELGL